ncbi:hypothetical protein K8I31_20580, partial [bacterium]|nr:hypothetical protein [bacterium]
MTTWRMSFRVGSRGYELWEVCYELSVAAITYNPLASTDLSKFPKLEPKNLWNKLSSPSQKSSLKRVAYEMKKGDIIFVKKGPEIVGRGIVQGSYFFDYNKKIIDPNGIPWTHQVPVKWDTDFIKIKKKLGQNQLFTVEKIKSEEVKLFQSELNSIS